jgi:Terminase small subunit
VPKPSQALSPTLQTLQGRTEETLEQAEKDYRDAFVREYLIDFRGDLALVRIGCTDIKKLKQRAYILLHETYVRNEITRRLREISPEDVVKRGQVMAKLWEEANDPCNEGSTRVKATAHIAKMLGMMQNAEAAPRSTPGVMMVPVMSLEDWQQAAQIAQQALKTNVGA